MESCCTCATVLSEIPRYADEKKEKPFPQDRRLECCSRVICGNCIHKNPRFETYCPYCQISVNPSLIPQGLKEPPSYQSVAKSSNPSDDAPPPYTPSAILASRQATDQQQNVNEKAALAAADDGPVEDTLHFLHHPHDTVASLSLRYSVPATVLRSYNNLTSDHLLLARRTVLIPGSHYRGGISLSPRPVEGEEEEIRKGKIRRWMVGCKVSDYDVALLYLQQADYDVDAAMEQYWGDEEWERNHPVKGEAASASGRRKVVSGRGFVRTNHG